MAYKIFCVRTISELSKHLVKFSENNIDSEEVWYRGHYYHYFNLKPSAYRSKAYRNNSGRIEKNSLSAAKSAMFHFPETQKLNTDFNWLSFLQHTGMPTRLLDWTHDYKVATYFALNKESQNMQSYEGLPSLWAFKPNSFIKEMIRIIKNSNMPISIKQPDPSEIISFFGDNKIKSAEEINEQMQSPSVRRLLNKIYIPFVSPYVNERAKVQGGCFLLFPLLHQRKDKFEDYWLDNFINRIFYNQRKRMLNVCLTQFIFIHPNQIKEEMKFMNLKKSRIYPEIGNIAEDIAKKYF